MDGNGTQKWQLSLINPEDDMGNYDDLEKEFIQRTVCLIDQYYASLKQYPFEEQFNYTLIINCLLGLIVLPKERIITYIPNKRLTTEYKESIGIQNSLIGENIVTLRDLIFSLRHAIAHFDISVISENDKRLIDWIEFKDSENGERTVAKFRSSEILPFLKHYTDCLIENLDNFRN